MTEWMRRGRLNHVTNAHNSRVDLVGVHVLQEETMESRRHEIKGIRILLGCLKVGDKLKAVVVERQNSVGKKRNISIVKRELSDLLRKSQSCELNGESFSIPFVQRIKSQRSFLIIAEKLNKC